MAATADVQIRSGVGDDTVHIPVKAATTIYKGSAVAIQDGYALPLTDGLKFAGIALEQALNTVAAGYGTAGDISIQVQRKGRMRMYLDNVSLYMLGAYVYAFDSNTFTLVPLETPIGKVIQVDGEATDYAMVEYDVDINRSNMGGVQGIFEPFYSVPPDGGVAANNTGKMDTWIKTSVNGPGIIDVIKAAQGHAYCAGLSIVPDTAENDGESIQMMGEPFLLDTLTRPVFFGTKLTVGVGGQDGSDIIFGLAITETSMLDNVTDDITWRIVDGSTDVKLYVEKDNTETASAASEHTLVDSVAVNLGFVYDGLAVYPYVNGVAGTGLVLTNLPDNEGLTPTIEVIAGMATHLGAIFSFMDAYQIV